MVRAVEATGTEVSDFNKGNIKARSRMIAQYALAGARSGAVIGTDHAAENITGFFAKIWRWWCRYFTPSNLNAKENNCLRPRSRSCSL